MWITLQDKHINFNTIQHFYRKEAVIHIMNIKHKETAFFYPSVEKAKQVIEYLRSTLAIREL